MNLEPKHPGTIPLFALFGNKGRVNLKEDVGEGSPEVGAIDVGVAGGFGVVEVFAFGAVEFDGLDVWVVGHAGGQERGRGAEDAGTFAEVGFFVFFELAIDIRQRLFSLHFLYLLLDSCGAEGVLERVEEGRTIFAKPLVVVMYRACTKPYRCLADFSICSLISSSQSRSKTSVIRSRAY